MTRFINNNNLINKELKLILKIIKNKEKNKINNMKIYQY